MGNSHQEINDQVSQLTEDESMDSFIAWFIIAIIAFVILIFIFYPKSH